MLVCTVNTFGAFFGAGLAVGIVATAWLVWRINKVRKS